MSPEEHLAAALAGLGFPDDPEMSSTPELVAGLLREFLPQRPPITATLPTVSTDPVIISGLPYHSLCAHHLLPFFGECSIAYRPSGQIVGLGWFPRILQCFARRPQLQERLCASLADAVMATLAPSAVGVKITARQMCVEMRGACSPGSFEVRAWRGASDPGLERLLG
jgi:GTP cyclohydrolase I